MLFLLLVLGTQRADATSVNVSLTKDAQGEGNKGVFFRPTDEFGNPAIFVMTAMSMLNPAEPAAVFPIAWFGDDTGPGTVYIGRDGAGVQNNAGEGSKEISGKGPHQNEELIFNFDSQISLDAITLGLRKIKYEDDPYVPGMGFIDDDPILFLHSILGDWYVVKEGAISTYFNPDPGKDDRGSLNLGDLNGAIPDIPDGLFIDMFKLRETNSDHGHIVVNQVTVPEPTTICLLGFGSLSLILRRRRQFGKLST